MSAPTYQVPAVQRAAWGHLATAIPTAMALAFQPIEACSPGVGEDARFLARQYHQLVDDPAAEAHAMGWRVPPEAPVPVTLAGVPDAEWSLEPDELAF